MNTLLRAALIDLEGFFMEIIEKESLVLQAALALDKAWSAGLTSDKEMKLILDVAQVIHYSRNKEEHIKRLRETLPNLLVNLSARQGDIDPRLISNIAV